jgi:DNA-binding MarR family transcriptional regulator
MKHDDTNAFILEDLVVPPSMDAKAPKSGPKAAHKRAERFIMITEAQAQRLAGVSVVMAVFVYLMFKELDARCSSFVLRPDALKHLGIDRYARSRALRDLAKRGLISMERRGGPRKPLTVTVLGSRKTKWRRAN